PPPAPPPPRPPPARRGAFLHLLQLAVVEAAKCRAAEDERDPGLAREVEDIVAQRARLLEEERRRRLGPHDQRRMLARGLHRELAVACHGLALEGGIPLLVLRDVTLREPNPELSRGRSRLELRHAPASEADQRQDED